MAVCVEMRPKISIIILSTIVLGLCHVASSYSVPRAFKITEENGVLSIAVKGVVLWRHSAKNPSLFVGVAPLSFREHRGQWKIEEVVERKIALPKYEYEHIGQKTLITFWNVDGPKVVLQMATDHFNPLIIHWMEVPSGYDRIWLRLHAEDGEHVYGGGEHFSKFDLRGLSYPVWAQELGVGHNKTGPGSVITDTVRDNNYHTSSFPLPTFVSSRRYYCHISGNNYINMDFKNPDFHEISITGPPDSIFMNVDAEFEALVRSLSYFLWRQPQFPRWVHTGAIIGVQGGTKAMVEYYKVVQEAGVKVSSLWIKDWSGTVGTDSNQQINWDWVWNKSHYPGLDKEIQRLRDEDVRVLGYITPNLNSQGTLFGEAKSKGYLLKSKKGNVYLQDFVGSECGTVDLTNPEAFQWYKGVITTNMIDLGFAGWMADYSEYTPLDVDYHDGADPQMMHNYFPVLWAKLNREAVREANKLGEIIFFMRSGGSGSQRFTTMTWVGDQNLDWSYSDGLPSYIPAALSLGMSGVGLTHFDIGLYAPPSPKETGQSSTSSNHNMTAAEELFLRSAELAVFTAVMRTDEGSQQNWQMNSSPDTLKNFATLTRIYRYLSTYRAAVEREQFRGGIPMQRPLFLHYQEEPETYTLTYQYLFGRDILVAPVIEPGVTSWKVYLPNDSWEHLITGEVLQGPTWVYVDAPIGRPPVFIRKDSKWRDRLIKIREPADLVFEDIPDPDLEGHCDVAGGCI